MGHAWVIEDDETHEVDQMASVSIIYLILNINNKAHKINIYSIQHTRIYTYMISL